MALSLVFASVIGWLLVPGWFWVIRWRIRLEETHMHEMFGSAYDIYARRTSRMPPGLY